MDLEAPVDAWYVWLGASLMTVALAGMALGLPSQPPPDATQAANTVDRVAGNDLGGTASYEHDARMVKLSPTEIALRNDGGTARATVSFGRMATVHANEDLEDVLYGAHPTDVYGGDMLAWQEFHDDVQDAEQRLEDPEWRTADGTLRVRTIVYDDPNPLSNEMQRTILIDV